MDDLVQRHDVTVLQAQCDGQLPRQELVDVVRRGLGTVDELDRQELLVADAFRHAYLGVASLSTRHVTLILRPIPLHVTLTRKPSLTSQTFALNL